MAMTAKVARRMAVDMGIPYFGSVGVSGSYEQGRQTRSRCDLSGGFYLFRRVVRASAMESTPLVAACRMAVPSHCRQAAHPSACGSCIGCCRTKGGCAGRLAGAGEGEGGRVGHTAPFPRRRGVEGCQVPLPQPTCCSTNRVSTRPGVSLALSKLPHDPGRTVSPERRTRRWTLLVCAPLSGVCDRCGGASVVVTGGLQRGGRRR